MAEGKSSTEMAKSETFTVTGVRTWSEGFDTSSTADEQLVRVNTALRSAEPQRAETLKFFIFESF